MKESPHPRPAHVTPNPQAARSRRVRGRVVAPPTAQARWPLGGLLGGAIFPACVLALLALSGCARPAKVASPPAAVLAPVTPPAATPAAPSPAPNPPPPYAALPPLEGAGWRRLFDGQTLTGWKVTDFAGHGQVRVKENQLILDMGAELTGVNGLATLPPADYEVALDAMKVDGSDFFCGLTFPVGKACCTLIVGGWGGTVVGVSSIDDNDASMNETTKFYNFEKNRWYRIRLRVTAAKLQAWIGREQVVDLTLEGHHLSMRPGEIELNQPFGIATYQTTAALRQLQWRPL